MENTLSIGIPTYNQGEFLEKTILSVLNQTIKPFEIVISNNHSTDIKTDEVLKKYKNQIRIISPPKFVSAVENWNFLCEHLTGKYFSLIFSDDWYETNFVETFYSQINEEAVLYRFGFNIVNEKGELITSKKIRSVKRVQKFPGNFYEQTMGPKVCIASFVVKKETFTKAGGFSERVKIDGDWELWLKVAPFGKFIYCPKIISNFRADYRPLIKVSRFNVELADVTYIYNIVQRKIIEKHGLSRRLFENAIKLRYYNYQSFVMKNNIDAHKEINEIKQLIVGREINSKFEYKARLLWQHFREIIIKK